MLAKEIKPGAVVNYQDSPCLIESLTVQTPSARGGATIYKFRTRNILTKQKVDISLKGSESLDEADFERRQIQYMYADGSHVHFLDRKSYEQYALPVEEISDQMRYVTEPLEGIQALVYQQQCVGIQLPLTVELKVTQCDPGVRGNSATSRTKPATLETGHVLQVPEYLAQGETIKVDTRTGEYLSRA